MLSPCITSIPMRLNMATVYKSNAVLKVVHDGVVGYAAKANLYMLEGAMLWDRFCTGLGIPGFMTVL